MQTGCVRLRTGGLSRTRLEWHGSCQAPSLQLDVRRQCPGSSEKILALGSIAEFFHEVFWSRWFDKCVLVWRLPGGVGCTKPLSWRLPESVESTRWLLEHIWKTCITDQCAEGF